MAKKPNTRKIGGSVGTHGEFLLSMVELVEAAHERSTTVVGMKTNGGVRPWGEGRRYCNKINWDFG